MPEPKPAPEPSIDRAASSSSARRASPIEGPSVARGPIEVGSTANRLARNPLLLPEIGRRIGDFVLEEAIGIGGMGAVFRALDTQLDRMVALKLLPPDQVFDPEVVQRFYQEARAAARLDHENIARVYAVGHDGAYHYIAFEYIEGTTIRRRVAEMGQIPVAEAINDALQIAGALVHAAERGVVHRDVKPSNIIVTPGGRAKLVDMGLARRFERGKGIDDGLTQSGTTLGTFDYISPEQARDPRDVDVRSDLYSLGCTLFHMLGGRPPFPDGTVLQKLLQHQEEPAPDVRTLNPAVPSELSAILLRLMAKDRDRRYQTPELLVRDLLAVAGGLGLRSAGAEGLIWENSAKPANWEKHLVWAVPAASLLLVVGGLFWVGQPLPEPGPAVASTTAPAPVPAQVPPVPQAVASQGVAPRLDRVVRDGVELTNALATAASGSTITLAGDGPFELAPAASGRSPGRVDLTLRAAPGARPVVRAGRGGAPAAKDGALLRFEGGRVVIEGVEFDPGGALSAISAEDADLTLRGCNFRRPGSTDARERPLAVRLRAVERAGADAARPTPARVVACHFDGGQAGIVARGPGSVDVVDSTFGPGPEPAVWLDNAGAPSVVAARLTLRHVSIMAGEGPALRFDRTAATVRVEDSVIAAARGEAATLVAADEPDRLDWYGRKNVYAGIDTYLRPTRELASRPATRRFAEWSDDPAGPRESDSTERAGAVWADPSATATDRDPSSAFALVATAEGAVGVGARRGPLASLPAPVVVASTVVAPPRRPPVEPPTAVARPAEMVIEPMPMPGQDEDQGPPIPAAAAVAPVAAVPIAVPAADAPIRTAAALLEALARPAAKGAVITLAADADLTLPGLAPAGTGARSIKAAPGATRPHLRFRPSAVDARATAGPPALFRLKGGSLSLQDIDITLAEADAPANRRWAAFGVWAGAELALTRCTVTVHGDHPRSAVAIVQAGDEEVENGLAGPDPSAASIRVFDSLLRAGGDLVDVAAGRKLDLAIEGSALAARGSLAHAHGLPRGQAAEPLRVGLRHVTARLAGGLVRLESVPGDPELPVAEVTARDCILATDDADAPLFRVDEQDGLDARRERISWDGHAIAYHNITTFRLDETAQAGVGPLRFQRGDWEMAVGGEVDPVHQDVGFVKAWDRARPPWTLTPEDVRLAPGSPAGDAGPDLKRLPNPPAEGPPR